MSIMDNFNAAVLAAISNISDRDRRTADVHGEDILEWLRKNVRPEDIFTDLTPPLALGEIARELTRLYHARGEIQSQILINESAIANTKVFLMPEGGWAGKNPEERTAAMLKTFAGNDSLCEYERRLLSWKSDLAITQGRIDGLEAQRRAAEWIIRAQEANHES